MNRIQIFIVLALGCTIGLIGDDKPFDLTIVGRWIWRDSMGRISIGIADCLKDDLKINFINVEPYHSLKLSDTPTALVQIAQSPDKSPGRVSLLVDHPWYRWNQPYTYMPKSDIKIAYAMTEATLLPKITASILNSEFDAIAVPDEWLIKVYQDSGVIKPIFVIPVGIYLDDFLNEPLKEKAHEVFTFGISAGFWPWKNHEKVLEAFAKEFGNNKKVRLIMHGRSGDVQHLYKFIKKEKINNVKIIVKEFSQQEYITFLRAIDCYLFLSRGEGFSITPREAMAMGIPVILSNNTAHKTICNSGLVSQVEATIERVAYYDSFSSNCGVNFDCHTHDVIPAMREMYKNYKKYVSKAEACREWTKQYRYSNLKDAYLTLVCPKAIMLSNVNKVESGVVMTTDQNLYDKYKKFIIDKK